MSLNDKRQWLNKRITGREKKVRPFNRMPANVENPMERNQRVRKSPFGNCHSVNNYQGMLKLVGTVLMKESKFTQMCSIIQQITY